MTALDTSVLQPPIISDTLDMAEQGVSVHIELLTPSAAELYLAYNTHNRKPKTDHINNLVRAIMRGEWMLNGETIIFSQPIELEEDAEARSRLLNGQNRLWAIVEAGRHGFTGQLPCLVVRGIDPYALYTIDGVSKRTVADALHLEGFTNTINLAATANLISAWEQGESALRSTSKWRLTPPQAVHLIHDRPDIVEAVRQAERIHRKMKNLAPQSLIAACWWRFYQIDADQCEKFFSSVASGLELKSDSPVYALRRILTKNHGSTSKKPRLVLHAWIIKAWNYYRNGQLVDNIVFRGDEAFPDPQ